MQLCGNLNKSISTSCKSVVSTTAHVKDCKVVLEDISSSRDAVKLKMLNKLKNCNSLTERLDLQQNAIYNEAANLFGHSQPTKRNLCLQSRRTKLSIQLIKEKNLLTAQINIIFLLDQWTALQQLLTDVKYKIRSLRKSERSRKRRWILKNAKNDFKSNPYNAGKTLRDPKCYVNLKVEQEGLEQHKSLSLIDINHDVPLADLEGLPDKPLPQRSFATNCFSFEDFFQMLHAWRNPSAPGLNGIPYKAYKKCPKLNKFLFKIFLSCMNKGIIPLQLWSAKEIYIPKVKPPTEHNISDFRLIALLNVEGKFFFSLVSRRLETHLINSNKFINKSVQKGCMEKAPGCWEHISIALKEAKSKNLSLAIIWL